jgi:antitoxin MazE
VKTHIVRIGNSQGVRIPKPLLEATGLSNEIEVEAVGNTLVIRAARQPREGWEEAFRAMAASGDDTVLESGLTPSRWDLEEWEWK